jgi:hypothetical protein
MATTHLFHKGNGRRIFSLKWAQLAIPANKSNSPFMGCATAGSLSQPPLPVSRYRNANPSPPRTWNSLERVALVGLWVYAPTPRAQHDR